MKKYRKYVPVILCLAFAIVMLCSYVVTNNNRDAVLQEQQAEIDELKNRIAVLQSTYDNTKSEILMTTTGLNLQRVAKDDAVIQDFLTLVCTWDSYEEYNNAREKIMRVYGIEKDSHFMSVFMPEVVNKVANDGTSYNRIDTMGLNMTYEGLKSYVTHILADEYSYFTLVTISSTWDNGGEATAQAAITYTVDTEGNLTNIRAIPIQ